MILSKESAENLRTMRKKRTTINQVIIRKKSKDLIIPKLSDDVIDFMYETSPKHEIDQKYLDTRIFQEEVSIISDETIEYINKRSNKHKISNKYKNTKLFQS